MFEQDLRAREPVVRLEKVRERLVVRLHLQLAHALGHQRLRDRAGFFVVDLDRRILRDRRDHLGELLVVVDLRERRHVGGRGRRGCAVGRTGEHGQSTSCLITASSRSARTTAVCVPSLGSHDGCFGGTFWTCGFARCDLYRAAVSVTGGGGDRRRRRRDLHRYRPGRAGPVSAAPEHRAALRESRPRPLRRSRARSARR